MTKRTVKKNQTSAPIDLVIFDCDGVLVDSEPLAMQVLLQTLAERGLHLSTEDAATLFLGRSMQSISQLLHEQYQIDFGTDALETVRRRLYQLFRQELQPIADIHAAIDQLSTKVCVASSSQPERIDLSLSLVGIRDLLQPNVFSATMVENGKPAPDLFLYAADKMGVAPTHCLVVEDSPAGIEAAHNAGMRVFAFTGGGHARSAAHRARIAASGATQTFEHMRDLNKMVAAASSGEL